MNVRLQTELHMAKFNWDLLRRLHFFDYVVEDFDLVNADFDALRELLRRRLVCLLKPRVRHHLLKTISKLGVRHENILDQALDFLTQIASEFIASVEDFLVQTLCV